MPAVSPGRWSAPISPPTTWRAGRCSTACGCRDSSRTPGASPATASRLDGATAEQLLAMRLYWPVGLAAQSRPRLADELAARELLGLFEREAAPELSGSEPTREIPLRHRVVDAANALVKSR